MGSLVEGKWVEGMVMTTDKKGAYDRQPRSFRDFISADHEIFKPESDRYHLYVSYACPWATRTLIYRKLKALTNHISFSVVSPDMGDQGWKFDTAYPGATKDDLYGLQHLNQIYIKADPNITTSVSVPVLWDKKTDTIVNNESSEIIRMFNSAFGDSGAKAGDYYPQDLRAEIDALNERIYNTVNNGVYRCGFATSQRAYDEAVTPLFDSLDWLEEILSRKRYLLGDQMTEADWRLYPTLVRFDLAYYGNFKCNLRRLRDYPNLWGYTREIYQMPGIAETSNLGRMKAGYYTIIAVNPTAIVPIGPEIDFTEAHGRG